MNMANTGRRADGEIVQLCVHDTQSSNACPENDLKAFIQVGFKPKQTKTVAFNLD